LITVHLANPSPPLLASIKRVACAAGFGLGIWILTAPSCSGPATASGQADGSGPGGSQQGAAGANANVAGAGGLASGAGKGDAGARTDGSTSTTDAVVDAPSDVATPDAGAELPPTDRTKTQLKDGWKFVASDSLMGAEVSGFDDAAWATISVPHTWDSPTGVTKHSNSWYRTHFTVAAGDDSKRFYVYFEGAFQVVDVYVNGQHLGQHRGGYTRFIFDATPAITPGDNVLAVQVSREACADCLPQGNPVLWKGYGGIYRKVWLETTNPLHVATTDYASSGVYVSTSDVSSTSASTSTKILLTNDGGADKTFAVKSVIDDATGKPVLTAQSDVLVKAGATTNTTLAGMVAAPHLWSPEQPYLYSVVVTVTVDGQVTDAIAEHIGFRSYQLTATDFTLNGVSTRLRGMAKHQETEYHASAVSDDELTADWDNLQELGVNYVRLVHYPHAQLEYDLADQRGIMVWAENGHTDAGDPTANADNINRELVYQNWNHPSIIFWSSGNEASGVAATTHYAGVLHATDPSRPTVYASDGQTPLGVDFIFQNIYPGWYGGTMYDFLTTGAHWISETGAGMVVATHTPDPFAMTFKVNSYEPEEYGDLVNEVRFDDLFRKPSHVPAYSGWVFRDVSDSKYKGLINTKGLITDGGYKKDAFYHLKSFLQPSPVVHLVGRAYFLRGADASGHGPVKAYSNAATLTLSVNGAKVGTLANNQYQHPNGTPIANVFLWPNALTLGKNTVDVDDGAGHVDDMTVYYSGAGETLPTETDAKVANLTSSNGPAYFIDVPIADQLPFYVDFDGTGDNTFDVVPAPVAGASFIATRRQSDVTKRTDLAFDLPMGADVFIMFTKQPSIPDWISAGGFTDTGTAGLWRDDSPKLVDFLLYKRTFTAGAHVALNTSAIDYVVLVK
jgi:beta-galactosidase